MSQFVHASAQAVRSHRNVVLAWLLALAAMVTIVLVLAIGDDSTDQPIGAGTAQSPLSSARPDESDVAAAVTGSSTSAFDSHPDEAAVATAVSGR
jgi:hypothetical protein